VPTEIRDARPADARQIALVHVRAWQEAYRGIMPDRYLDALTVDQRLPVWRGALEGSPPRLTVFIAEQDAVVVGFVAVGAVAGEDGGEVHYLNVTPSRWRRGLGARLLQRGEDALVAAGYREAILWVVKANDPARRFYEHQGWQPEAVERVCAYGGVGVPDVRYRRRWREE
jgi:ribosomal protein S18 acetylase RimI-like enzyme